MPYAHLQGRKPTSQRLASCAHSVRTNLRRPEKSEIGRPTRPDCRSRVPSLWRHITFKIIDFICTSLALSRVKGRKERKKNILHFISNFSDMTSFWIPPGRHDGEAEARPKDPNTFRSNEQHYLSSSCSLSLTHTFISLFLPISRLTQRAQWTPRFEGNLETSLIRFPSLAGSRHELKIPFLPVARTLFYGCHCKALPHDA